MTQRVADEAISRFARQQHDWMGRVLKGSLDPTEVARVVQAIINRGLRYPLLSERKLLKPVATATAAKDPPFVNEFFQSRPGLYVWDSFRERFDLEALSQSVGGRPYVASLLKSNAYDRDIRRELPENNLSALEDIAGFIEAQPNGKEGFLLTNGYANIFYVEGRNGEVFAVGVLWVSDGRGWFVYDWLLDEFGLWDAGRQVLCPGNAAL